MRYITLLVAVTALFFSSYIAAEDSVDESTLQKATQNLDLVQFTPPQGWRFAEGQTKLKNVHSIVVGQGQHEFPPSLTLGVEQYPGTLKEYLKIVKTLSGAHGGDWKDLGTIRTEAGEASLSQEDTKSVWGDLRMMHVILAKNGSVYILTAAALKEEFPQFYPEFFNSMRSLRIEHELRSADVGLTKTNDELIR